MLSVLGYGRHVWFYVLKFLVRLLGTIGGKMTLNNRSEYFS